MAQAGYCSISHLQRQLGVGYNKAAKLVERMEKDGVVGPARARPADGATYSFSRSETLLTEGARTSDVMGERPCGDTYDRA